MCRQTVMPPFLEHVARGAAFGAVVGSGIAGIGWFVRQRNEVTIELGVPAPNVLARHRPLAETLVHFEGVSHHSEATKALYAQVVRDCEFVCEHEAAERGAAQVAVQKRLTQALTCARRLAREAFRHRDPKAHDCRLQIEALEAHLGAVQKNMMMG